MRFQAHGYWQDSVSHSCRTEVPTSCWLSAGSGSQLPQATCFPRDAAPLQLSASSNAVRPSRALNLLSFLQLAGESSVFKGLMGLGRAHLGTLPILLSVVSYNITSS